MSAGLLFRQSLKQHSPLQILGVINAYSALQATKVGAKALYLSGAGVANASIGVPDLGITNLEDVLIDARRITAVSNLPLLVDIDTGFGGAFNIARTIKEMIRAGVAAVHIEDQVAQKRCGHRPNKELVSKEEMCDRVKIAVHTKNEIDKDFVIMARTDAHASEGQKAAIDRALAYVDSGADMIFAEAIHTLEEYAEFAMALYPLSAFRAMNKAALEVFTDIITNGHQKLSIDKMQTREELYNMLGYYEYEKQLDELFHFKNKEQK